jgi:SanA protein
MRAKTKKKLMALCVAVAVVLAAGFTAWSNAVVDDAAKGLVYTDANSVPVNKVGIVLGTAPFDRYGVNLDYVYRMDAAAELYRCGRVSLLIVSGDPWQPPLMRDALVARGVPETNIMLDRNGQRTLASIIEARDTFGVRSFTVISQPAHCARAIYLARAYGCQAVGYAAIDPGHFRTRVREVFARPKAALDVYVLHRNPKAAGHQTGASGVGEPNTHGG